MEMVALVLLMVGFLSLLLCWELLSMLRVGMRWVTPGRDPHGEYPGVIRNGTTHH